MDAAHVHGLRAAIARTRAGRDADAMADALVRPGAEIAEVLRRLRRAGHERAAAVELAPAVLEVHVVKVIVPGLLVSELL
jgi:ribosomal protein S12 methylthiotransferase accessory factor YcaO